MSSKKTLVNTIKYLGNIKLIITPYSSGWIRASDELSEEFFKENNILCVKKVFNNNMGGVYDYFVVNTSLGVIRLEHNDILEEHNMVEELPVENNYVFGKDNLQEVHFPWEIDKSNNKDLSDKKVDINKLIIDFVKEHYFLESETLYKVIKRLIKDYKKNKKKK